MTMYVSALGVPYVRKMKGGCNGMPMTVRLSQYGRPVHARPAAPTEIADVPDDRMLQDV
ncbi:hypothetical protein [Streptomyces sp. NPDC002205]|uniref:hypothetical protein n=1 Tax=Streptomyces sp. NPDC002205 TaxID=3154411 RepID=UPI00332D5540